MDVLLALEGSSPGVRGDRKCFVIRHSEARYPNHKPDRVVRRSNVPQYRGAEPQALHVRRILALVERLRTCGLFATISMTSKPGRSYWVSLARLASKATRLTRAFAMTSTDHLSRLVFATLEAVQFAGFSRCLVLVDELDAPFLLGYALRERDAIFSEFLRGYANALTRSATEGPDIPAHAGPTIGDVPRCSRSFEPSAITRQLDSGGVMGCVPPARTEHPFILDPPSKEELMAIARQRD